MFKRDNSNFTNRDIIGDHLSPLGVDVIGRPWSPDYNFKYLGNGDAFIGTYPGNRKGDKASYGDGNGPPEYSPI